MFKGNIVAIATSFDDERFREVGNIRVPSIDESSLEGLINFQIENGVSGIVPCGTTGESPTLNNEEHKGVIALTVECVNKRVPVIAGTGGNSTEEAIELTKFAKDAGADASLQVSPYYNKPTQEGLYRHFKAIADSVDLPMVIYNIKGRTAVNIETSTLMRIVNECSNVVGVKEASGDLKQMQEVIEQRPKGFSVLSGDDNKALDLIKLGGDGVVSVASNFTPYAMDYLVSSALRKDYATAEIINKKLSPLFEAEFIETNPIPIKYMLSKKGLCKEVYRLPLCEMSDEHKKGVDKVLEEGSAYFNLHFSSLDLTE